MGMLLTYRPGYNTEAPKAEETPRRKRRNRKPPQADAPAQPATEPAPADQLTESGSDGE